MSQRPLVFVAMSGGVDSSVAAALLLEQGFRVAGVTMRLWTKDGDAGPASCCSVEGAEDARIVCQTLGIPFYILNFEDAFQRHVVDYFVAEYFSGRTPNPCLECNRRMKFDLLLRRAVALGADFLATGHYARILSRSDGFHLLKGVDPGKDQSYVLYTLRQQELSHLLFPVGGLRKAEVRQKALSLGLPVAKKPDSQEICFIPDGDHVHFLRDREVSRPGDVIDIRGRVLGRHEGLFRYTVGQRHGLGIACHERLYVTAIDPARNTVTVGATEDLRSNALLINHLTFVGGPPPFPLNTHARVRYHAPEIEGVLEPKGDGAVFRMSQPHPPPAPGQAVVFYSGDEVLGGGTMEAPVA